MDRARRSPALRLVMLVVGQALALATLVAAADRPPVAGAPVARGLLHWVGAAPPLDAVVVVTHRVALLVALWLLAGTLLHVAATVTRVPLLVRVTARAALPGVCRAVTAVVVTAGVITPGIAHAAPAADGRSAAGVRDGRAAPPVIAVSTTTTTTPTTTATTAAATPTATSLVVQPGDSLWSIAERSASSEPGTDVGERWAEICAANAGRLRSGDLAVVYPGEEIVIPGGNPG